MNKKLLAMFLVVVMAATAVIGGTLAYFTDTADQTNTFTVGKVDIKLDETKVDGEQGERTENDQTFEDKIVPGHVFDKDPMITVKEGSEDSYLFLDITINKYKSLVPVMALDAANDPDILFTMDDFNSYVINDNNTKFSTKTFLTAMKDHPDVFQPILEKWFTGINPRDWKVEGFFYDVDKNDTTKDGNWMTMRLTYTGSGDPIKSENEKVTFMTQFHMPASVTQEMINNPYTANHFNEGDPFQMNFKAYAIQADTFNNVEEAFVGMFGDFNKSHWNSFN